MPNEPSLSEIFARMGEQAEQQTRKELIDHALNYENERFTADPKLLADVKALQEKITEIVNDKSKPIGVVASEIIYYAATMGFLVRDIPPSVLCLRAAQRFRDVEMMASIETLNEILFGEDEPDAS